MTTTTLTPEQKLMPDWTLTANDRCDRCGARAYFRVTVRVDRSDLHFCAHHGREAEPKLRPICADWVDETDALNMKLDVSP